MSLFFSGLLGFQRLSLVSLVRVSNQSGWLISLRAFTNSVTSQPWRNGENSEVNNFSGCAEFSCAMCEWIL